MKPRMDFSTKYCLYDCHRCAEVCPTGAIRRLPITAERGYCGNYEGYHAHRRSLVLRLPLPGCPGDMDCGACTEHCPTKALYTVPYIGRDGQEHRLPRLDPSPCIGCGACEHACPVTTERPEERARLNTCNLCEEKVRVQKRREMPPPRSSSAP